MDLLLKVYKKTIPPQVIAGGALTMAHHRIHTPAQKEFHCGQWIWDRAGISDPGHRGFSIKSIAPCHGEVLRENRCMGDVLALTVDLPAVGENDPKSEIDRRYPIEIGIGD